MNVFLKQLLSMFLTVYYSAKVLLLLAMAILYERSFKVLKVKDRPVPPKCLQNPELGTHNYITTDSKIKLHYVEKGDRSKPLMLMIHGFPEFWYSWRYQLKEFSKDYWCVAVDMRGYGDSDKPKGLDPYEIDNMIADIRGLLKKFERKTMTLLCHDWGAVIGWRYVLNHMDTIDKYVMIGAPPLEVYRKLSATSWDQFRKGWYVHFFRMPFVPELSLRAYDLRVMNAMKSANTDAEDIEAYKYTFAKPGALTCPINYYRANGHASKGKRPDKFQAGLYLLGETERYISLDTGKQVEEFIPNVTFKIVPNASHFAQQDDYVTVNRMIREHLAKS